MGEMVVKLWGLMGFSMEKEEEEGGEVVVIVGMEEEMEERKVEELVVKVVEMEGRLAGQDGGTVRLGAAICWK